jgi:membrane protein YdbS with pleckstrin-like domain
VDDGVARQLDPNIVVVRRIGGAIAAAFATVGTAIPMLVFLFSDALPVPARLLVPIGWMGLALLLAILAVVWPKLRYRYETYKVVSDGIEIQRGVIWRTVISVPKSRIQHTDVSRGPLERGFGLATLIVYTAGTEHASVSLAGLAEVRAFAIRDHLIPGDRHDAV